jgi:hypothetical protein
LVLTHPEVALGVQKVDLGYAASLAPEAAMRPHGCFDADSENEVEDVVAFIIVRSDFRDAASLDSASKKRVELLGTGSEALAQGCTTRNTRPPTPPRLAVKVRGILPMPASANVAVHVHAAALARSYH